MGCPRPIWLRAALKELIDNSLDAAEEAGIEPAIRVALDENILSVSDNGPGMSPELVERLCIRSERTSTREAYAAPDRGVQGNAVQVIVALPLGLGRDEAVTAITSRGVEHRIILKVNRLQQQLEVERTERAVPETPGTKVGLTWPSPIDANKIAALVAQHAVLNPHARFQLRLPGYDGHSAEPTPVAKWTPGLPTPAHWYALERFGHRVLLEINRDRSITVAQFLGAFKGLTSRTLRSQVAETAGLSYARLAALLDASGTALDQVRARRLLVAMQDASRAPKHVVLGAVGKARFERPGPGTMVSASPSFLLTPQSTV
jgi:DNA topoisomerase VI subunit B